MITGGAGPDVAAILGRCRSVLGPCELVADRSMSHGEAIVLALAGADGAGWIAKCVLREKKYRQELTAYREWVPALGDAAPTLHSAHHDLHLVLLNALDGRIVQGTPAEHDPDVHHRIGTLTRLLHGSTAPLPVPGFAEHLAHRLEGYVVRGRALLSRDEIDFARGRVAALAGLPPVGTVPCHLDNHPRNWLLGDDGVVRMIDFGHAERQPWIRDINRMHFGCWRGRPELYEAFFDGYGRAPSDEDWRVYQSCVAYIAVSTIVWAHEHGDTEFERDGRAWLGELMDA